LEVVEAEAGAIGAEAVDEIAASTSLFLRYDLDVYQISTHFALTVEFHCCTLLR